MVGVFRNTWPLASGKSHVSLSICEWWKYILPEDLYRILMTETGVFFLLLVKSLIFAPWIYWVGTVSENLPSQWV